MVRVPKKIMLILSDDGNTVSLKLGGDISRLGVMDAEDLELIEQLALRFFSKCAEILKEQGGFRSCADPTCPNCSERPLVN